MKKFKDIKVSQKLLFSFAVIAFFFLISQVISIFSIRDAASNMESFYNEEFQKVRISKDMQADYQGYAKAVYKLSLAYETKDTQSDIQSRLDEMQTYLTQLGTDIDELKGKNIVNTDVLDTIGQKYQSLKTLTSQLTAYFERNEDAKALALNEGDITTTGKSLNESLDVIIEKAQELASGKFNATQTAAVRLQIISVVLTIIVIILSIILCISLTHMITRPLREMESVAKELAEGKLDLQIAYHSEDELGTLAENLRVTIEHLKRYISALAVNMDSVGAGKLNISSDVDFKGDFAAIQQSIDVVKANLTKTIIQINDSTEQVLRGAEQIAGSGQALSQATLEQASSVEELGATVNDLSGHTHDNAENAMETSRLATQVGQEMVTNSELLQELSSDMRKMTDMSDKINGIVKDIEDIAFQTNILSLNAAVEAARAGEAGRGFSVVAGEIRRLSEKTTEASRRTRELISETIHMMANSASQAENVSAKMLQVTESTQQAVQKIDMISRASGEQATAIVQLRESIDMISDVVQENSATAEESAASSEELTGQMQMLKQLVDEFEYDA